VPTRTGLTISRPSRPSLAGLAVLVASLAAATALAALIRSQLGVPHAATIYLLVVVVVGTGYGSWMAVSASVASFLLYDFFFIRPYYTFAVAASEEWLDLLLFLVVAITIGRLSTLQLERRREAELRSAEARAMFAMSRDIATTATASEAAPLLASRLAREAEMSRVWIGLGGALPEERVVADTQPEDLRPAVRSRWVLHSSSADTQPSWAKVRDTVARAHGADDRDEHLTILRVPIIAGGGGVGSLWATRARGAPFPGRSHSRLLAAAADQLGQSVERDRLAAEATTLEVARQGDALKSAVLDSVSHDLRTPLAAIRAAAGSLIDPDGRLSPEEATAAAVSIDVEAQRLSRLVRNMLDLGRIEGGALSPSLELYDLADLVDPVIERLAALLSSSEVEVNMPIDLPAVKADGIFVDQILANLLENAARHAAGKAIRVSARAIRDEVALTVEDAGPGVPTAALPHLFERFFRVPGRPGGRSDGSSGVGLTVVRGLTMAMGGSVEAKPSAMGGLAVTVRLAAESVRGPDAPTTEAATIEAAVTSEIDQIEGVEPVTEDGAGPAHAPAAPPEPAR
jgi:two-component system sensor histidine kinase KdpD